MTTEWNKMVAILRHSLGIQWAHDKEYRDYYCACVGEDRLERMADKCLNAIAQALTEKKGREI